MDNEIFDEFLNMLMAALKLAGVKDDRMQEALDAYEEALDSMSDEQEYDYNDIVKIILDLKNARGDLFE